MERKRTIILVCILLLFFTILSLLTIKDMSVTFDEANFVTAGYSYWKTGDFRLVVEHPPLVKLLAGFPLLFMNPEPVLSTETEAWQQSATTEGSYVNQWYVSQNFLYLSRNDAEKIIFLSRLPFIFLGIVLGLYIFLFAKELYGEVAAIFALFLYTFCPLILAYIPLVITDGAFAVFFFITIYYFWKWRKETHKNADAFLVSRLTYASVEKTKYLLLAGLFFGLANATKFTGLYLIPVFGFLLFYEWYNKEYNKEEKRKKIGNDVFSYFIILGISIVIVSASYFFIHFPLYFEGFKVVAEHSEIGHTSYLLGNFSTEGWWYYFIVAFFVKTPIPLLLFMFLAFLFWKKTEHRNMFDTFVILLPAILYFAAFMLNNINIGIRHILPIYPFLFVFCGNLLNAFFDKKMYRIIFKTFIIILSLWYLWTALFYFPSYIAYFNELAGGPQNGHKILLDSNIDWSQDLERTEQWLRKNNLINEPLYYDVFTVEPNGYRPYIQKQISCGQRIGLYVISVNEIYDLAQKNNNCLRWLIDYDPIARIGYSIYIYNITDSFVAAVQNQCASQCTETCVMNNKTYVDYYFTDQCVCACV